MYTCTKQHNNYNVNIIVDECNNEEMEAHTYIPASTVGGSVVAIQIKQQHNSLNNNIHCGN